MARFVYLKFGTRFLHFERPYSKNYQTTMKKDYLKLNTEKSFRNLGNRKKILIVIILFPINLAPNQSKNV